MTDNVALHQQPMIEPLLTVADVAKRLSISKSMAWKLINDGRLTSYRIGRAVRIEPGSVQAFVAASARKTPSKPSAILAAVGYSPMGYCRCGAEAKRTEPGIDGDLVPVCEDHGICPDCFDMCSRGDRCGRTK